MYARLMDKLGDAKNRMPCIRRQPFREDQADLSEKIFIIPPKRR